MDEDELSSLGEEAAQTRRRMEEERRGRMCPICLGKPVAGRMTKCGHIFCFPCILHYIQLSDIPKSAKCPICGDTVHEGMLKSVKYLDATSMLDAQKGEVDSQDGQDGGDQDNGGVTPTLAHVHSDDHGGYHHHDAVLGEMEGFEEAHDGTRAVDALSESGRTDGTHAASSRSRRVHMRLIQRPPMTTLALPSSPTWPSDAIPPHTAPWFFLPDILSYSRHMLASPEYMLSELQRELAELQKEWQALAGDALGRDFVSAAREKVERQVGKVQAELMTDLVRRSESESREAWGVAVGGEIRERERRRERERQAQARANQARLKVADDLAAEGPQGPPLQGTWGPAAFPSPAEELPTPASTPGRRPRKRVQAGPPTPAATVLSPSYYFYQSSLGANVFLHPLDIRILLAYFGSYSAFPPMLSFASSGFDPGTITEELRKRCKYLSHLPLGTEVVFVEAELEDIVGKQGLAAFEQPLKIRREKRRARVRREDRAKSKWEKEERERRPTPVTSTPSAMRIASVEDHDFALALARSAVDSQAGSSWGREASLGPGSAGASSPFHTPGTSPNVAAGVWGAGATPGRPTFASTAQAAASAPLRLARERADPMDSADSAAWDAAFERLGLGERGDEEEGQGAAGGEGEGKGRKAKKGGRAKKVLVLGGGGGRRA